LSSAAGTAHTQVGAQSGVAYDVLQPGGDGGNLKRIDDDGSAGAYFWQ
jgi:hypothetical protein